MNPSICIAINVVSACMLIWCVQRVLMPYKLAILCIWVIIFNINLGFGFSICDYTYALFDSPSMLLVLLSLLYLMRVFCASIINIVPQDIVSNKWCKRLEQYLCICIFPPLLQCIWAIFGIVLYAGFFGYGFLDIYHLEFRILAFILAFLSVICYVVCPLSGFIFVLCVVGYEFKILGDMSVLSYCIDPFLWLWCVFMSFWRFCRMAVKWRRK